MTHSSQWKLLFVFTVLLAWALRLPNLSQRPMHTDEAVHALKFGELLENSTYRYDPAEYHGPILNYATLVPARVIKARNIENINESTLRIVPVFFGAMMILLLLILRKSLGWPVVILASLFTAITPPLVFYSRYYIQEILLLFFTLGALASFYRYRVNPKFIWAILFGLFCGFMHTAKETCIIAWAAMIIAWSLTMFCNDRTFPCRMHPIKWSHVLLAVVTGFAVSAAFYSSFFQNASGILDSFKTFSNYINRATLNQTHTHPWYYYLQLSSYFHSGAGPIWSNLLILLLSAFCILAVFSGKRAQGIDVNLMYYLTFYTLFMTVSYSLIPYKTPWSMLSFFHGLVLMAALGAVLAWEYMRSHAAKVAFTVFILAGTVHLCWQTVLLNTRYQADPRNPYVYGHTSNDIFKIVQRIQQAAHASPESNSIYMEVICPGDDYWPLPWYLRNYKHVGWWSRVDNSVPAAPVIICSPQVENDLLYKLYTLPPPGTKNLYVPLFDASLQLRPGVEIRGYVVNDLWDKITEPRL